MIRVNDLVHLQRRVPKDPRSTDIGIVTGVKDPPAGFVTSTVTVLWTVLGEEETWAEDGLELITMRLRNGVFK
jgi:hypothetical protein